MRIIAKVIEFEASDWRGFHSMEQYLSHTGDVEFQIDHQLFSVDDLADLAAHLMAVAMDYGYEFDDDDDDAIVVHSKKGKSE